MNFYRITSTKDKKIDKSEIEIAGLRETSITNSSFLKEIENLDDVLLNNRVLIVKGLKELRSHRINK